MIGKRSFGEWLNAYRLRKQRVAAAVVLLLMLGLQGFELRAELLFRSAEQINGQQGWSPIRKYSNPSDTAYARVSASAEATPAEEVRVFLSGEITQADVESALVMASLLKSGKQKIAGNTVWLASNGGDIDAGMELGRLLRQLHVVTLIDKNDRCLSACVFAFMGGERRSVAGQLGIHRPFLPFTEETPNRQVRFRLLQKTLKSYMEELDFPDSLYEAMMAVPPESMQILAPADLKRFYLEGMSPSSEDIADAASARRLGISMFEYLQRKAKAPACALLVASQGRCEGNAPKALASGGAADDPGRTQTTGSASAGRVAGHGDTQGIGTSRGTSRGAPR